MKQIIEIKLEWNPRTIDREIYQNGYLISSGVLVCPTCKSTWAELTIEGDPIYVPRMVSCEYCQWFNEISEFPGTLLFNQDSNEDTDWGLLEALPEDLLKRELNLHLKQTERQINEYRTRNLAAIRALASTGSERLT